MTELLYNISAATLSQKGTDQEISHKNVKLVFWWSGHNTNPVSPAQNPEVNDMMFTMFDVTLHQ